MEAKKAQQSLESTYKQLDSVSATEPSALFAPLFEGGSGDMLKST